MTGANLDPAFLPDSGPRSLRCGDRVLDLSRPRVMGVLNVTPDSFSDGGELHRDNRVDLDRVLSRAAQMVADGAAILDVGGESTRPGAAPVSPQQELDRVVATVEALAGRFDVVVSVDTSAPEVMRAAAAAGATLINDVRALQRDGALAAAAATGLPVCLMHMQGQPADMQADPRYAEVADEVADFLTDRVRAAVAAGIAKSSILLDPGFGFGKSVDHNLCLLNRLDRLAALGFPVLVGLSRKSLIGKLLGREVDQRLAASLSLAVIAAERGASIVRCHDVRETVDALTILHCVKQECFEPPVADGDRG